MPYKRTEKNRKPWLGQIRIGREVTRKAFATKREAIEWEVIQRDKTILLIDTTSLAEWALEYLDFAEKKFSKKTFLEKRACFKRFFKAIDKDKSVDDLKSKEVLKHLSVQSSLRSGHAANKDRKNLVAAWEWGVKYLDMPPVNTCKVERFPEKRSPRYVPVEEDFWKIFNHAWTTQDATMLLAYLHLAARKSELFRLKWDDVDFAEDKVRLFSRKTKDGSWEEGWLPMTEDLKNSLLRHKSKAYDPVWVFTDLETGYPFLQRRHWMKNLCKRAGVKHFGLHAIRHLTASILAKSGVPMINIQTILRHKHLTTTERYIKRLDSIRPAMNVLPGLDQKNKKSHPETTPLVQKLKMVI